VSFEAIVIDNASADGSADAIAEAFPQARLIRCDQNLGFAAANNLAARGATGEFILLLNSDTEVLDGAIQRVVAFARRHTEAGIVGGRTFFADGQLNRNSCHGRPTPWSMLCLGTGLASLFRHSALLNPEGLGPWRRDTVREVDAITGCFLLIRSELWRALRGFDESFFMYGEDTDLCLRARRANSRCVVCPEARVIHHGGASDRVRPDKIVRLFRAKAQLVRKHWQPSTVWLGLGMLRLWPLSRAAALGLLRLARPRLREAHAAWREVWQRRAEFMAPVTAPTGTGQ
jgi:GT2 family glycosyltransferase